ncbi:CpxP family protein [Vibrio sagamiensis]|uniref:Periplasmic repressor CpxP n=1 Tax=Vibrio sagamiensis NBRC 104589 TaxID=1219064 RepID=A0A511QH80_9VIBR|nr:CpxP family protein [Vibrio sagamiensis]PNQ71498.1 stress adaptor protein CpxP [Vibrio agarivorans]GEM76621.1 periplasmic repressor CpxP [Vibrio sagamiensis NBRC 104589]
MKLTKKFVLAAMVLPLTLGTASAFASVGKAHTGDKCMSQERALLQQLDLTDSQKEQIKELRKFSKLEKKQKFAKLEERKVARLTHKDKVQALVLADNFDKEAATKLAKEMVEKQTERRVALLEKKHKLLSVLTPAQKVKYAELKKARLLECAEKKYIRLEEKHHD